MNIINKFFKFCILGILYNALMYKNEFGQAHRIELLSKIPTKFILCFQRLILVSMNSGNLHEFLGLKINLKENFKT
jgi:hypothetical protein